MKKTISSPILISLILLEINSASLIAQDISSKYFTMKLSDWARVDSSKTKYTPSAILDEADTYYKEINQYLFHIDPIELDRKIAVSIVPRGQVGGSNWAQNRHIYINAGNVETGFLPLAHEITHTILCCSSLQGYSEGLADYFQNMFTPYDKQYFFYKGNSHQKLKVLWTHYSDENNVSQIIGGYLHNGIYTEAESLVKYLIDRFGVDIFIQYFNGGGYKSYVEVFGVSEEQIQKEWTAFVMQQEPDQNWTKNWNEIDMVINY